VYSRSVQVHYVDDAGALVSVEAAEGHKVYPLRRVRDAGAVVPLQRGGFHARQVLHVPKPERGPADQGEGERRGWEAEWPVVGEGARVVSVAASLAVPQGFTARERVDANSPRAVRLAWTLARDAFGDRVEHPGPTGTDGETRTVARGAAGGGSHRRLPVAVETCAGLVVLYNPTSQNPSAPGWRPAVVAAAVEVFGSRAA
jgi:hypothetical protein